jgi:hypothetical protein
MKKKKKKKKRLGEERAFIGRSHSQDRVAASRGRAGWLARREQVRRVGWRPSTCLNGDVHLHCSPMFVPPDIECTALNRPSLDSLRGCLNFRHKD